MHMTWNSARAAHRSPLNVGRSTARNKRKQMRGEENRTYRAALNREKVSARSPEAANLVQIKIDEIRNRR